MVPSLELTKNVLTHTIPCLCVYSLFSAKMDTNVLNFTFSTWGNGSATAVYYEINNSFTKDHITSIALGALMRDKTL